MQDNSPQSAVLGASGEYLVLSHLLRLNFVAGKSPDNTKDYDLIVLNRDGTSSSPIQVKTTFKEMHWLLQEKHEKPIKNLIFCFVYMSKNTHESEIFVIDSKIVASAISTAHKIWLKLPGLKGRKHNDSPMRALHRDFNFFTKLKNYKKFLNKEEIKFIKEHSLGWIDKYKNAWDLIRK
jgi:hypothetical protein